MPASTPTRSTSPAHDGETYLLRPGEVMDLLRITRTTLHEWRTQGRLQAVRPHATAHWRYPADQPALVAALEAVRAPR